jgi:fructose-bisphosphate aldolase class II
MLYTMKEILSDAQKRGYGVGYFNAVNLEMIRAYVRAAEDRLSPIIIGTAEALLPYGDFDWLGPLLLHAARSSRVPVAVHLDHAYSFETIMRALHAGFGSVMYDGSLLGYEENVKNSAEIARTAHPMGVGLECELGKVGGLDEGEGLKGENIYTDPDQAADFVERSGADFLAVSIGTIHGTYAEKPRLDLRRLGEIRAKVEKPLVLHGGSGLSEEDFKNCIRGGICKVNIYTDVVGAALEVIRRGGDAAYVDLNKRAEGAMYAVTAEKIAIFGSGGKY